jgi:5-methylcytosine-specific restriction enzyme A
MQRPCLEAGCPEFAVYRGRCAEHARINERDILRIGRAVYATKRWRILRRRKLRANPICERCDRRLATDVHHKRGVAVDPWSWGELESLCHSCHSRETARELRERAA